MAPSQPRPPERPGRSAAAFPADPYPGTRPDYSFVQDAADRVHRIVPAGGGWAVERERLDDWLAARDAGPLAGRSAVLAYGSNVCPSKISWLRGAHGLAGPVVVVRARCVDLAAVWADGFRTVDDQRPAILAGRPGHEEWHAIWWATPDQIRSLDGCEGRGSRYQLARLGCGTVELEDGATIAEPLAYVGLPGGRMPLLVDGETVLCSDMPQARAAALQGVPATRDGLEREVLAG